VIPLVALLVLGGGAAAVILSGVLDKHGASPAKLARQREQAAEQAASARFIALKTHLMGPFTAGMHDRDAFFVAERAFLSAMEDANSQLRKYRSDLASVTAQNKQIDNANAPAQAACANSTNPCPNPTYVTTPSAPDVTSDIHRLRAATSRLNDLHARVLDMAPPEQLKAFYSQLQAAIEALTQDASQNADILTTGVTAPNPSTTNDTGNVDAAKIDTLRGDEALPAIRAMNQEALTAIGTLKLSLSDWDVRGGHDLDPADHSTS